MLPSKGYFNSLECPFFLSSTHCTRPYCHYKHPKRNQNTAIHQAKAENNSNDHVGFSLSDAISTPVEDKPSAVVKHIPIAYIPTKPSGVSVNIKKPKNVCMYVPSAKSDSKSSLMGSIDYHPSAVMDSCEKTYSRYSYEKGHDSGDEIMENHKSLIDSNKICKFDDNSKSGCDEETTFLEEPAFSPLNSENEDAQEELMDDSKLFSTIHEIPTTFCKSEDFDPCIKDVKSHKRKYSDNYETNSDSIKVKTEKQENDLSESDSVKRIKIEESDNSISKKIKSEKSSTSSSSKSSVKGEGTSLDQSKKDKKEAKHVDSKSSSKSHKISDDKKKEHTDHKKSSSDAKSSSKSSHKHSSTSSSSDSKKHQSNKKSSDSKKSSSEINKKHSSGSKNSSSKDKKHSSDINKKTKKESSSSSNKTSDSKKNSDKSSRKSSHDVKHSSKSKMVSSTKDKKDKEVIKSSSKNKDSSSSKSSDGKHSEKNKEHSNKKSSKHDKNHKSKSDHSRHDVNEKCHKRGRSDSSGSLASISEPKETILISDSSDSEGTKIKSRNSNSPVGVDDIFGLSDTDDDNGTRDNNHEISDSASDDEYSPMPLSGSKQSPVYNPSLTSRKKVKDSEILQHFKTAPQSSVEDYKPSQTAAKVRIAHVPNVSSLLSAKNLISSGKTVPPAVQKMVTSLEMTKPKTPFKTHSQVVSNHRPKPQVSLNLNSVVALNIRQPGLNNIYDELMKYVDYEEACQRAIEEENEICNVATNPQSYRNRIALCILRIRKSKGAVDVVQKERITSNSIPDYTYGLTLYECFSKYLLQPEDYILHGYPLELLGKPGCAYIDKNSFFRSKRVEIMEGPFRKCINCGKEYAVDEETGIPLTKNNCHHHWGKLIGMRQGKIYTCCKSEVGSDPCHTAMYHVTELKNEDCLEGFVKTKPYPSNADPNKAGIFAMDCEMCFTTKGRDIVRASLLAIDNESVYDVLIKPKNPILDYCTRFSGITEDKLKNVTTTLEDVQMFLLNTINDKTILVGHSLENDLKALKLLHYNVVDTSIMFPHKEGFPVKCALRTLCSRILGTAIQTGENGHDSLEDARGSLQLVLHQVREDAKSRKPRVVKQLKSTK